MPFDQSQRTGQEEPVSPRDKLSRQQALQAAKRLKAVQDEARAAVKRSQERQTRAANKHCREPDFKVGDKVFIIKKSQSTDRPNNKLDFPLTRTPYEIVRIVGHSYELETPPTQQGSRIFHADRLRKDPGNPLPGQANTNPTREIINNEEEWEVEKVVSSRLVDGKVKYQVDWKGQDPNPEWYLAEVFKNAAKKLKEYHNDEANHNKPGPPKRLGIQLRTAKNRAIAKDYKDNNLPLEGTAKGKKLRRRK